MPYDFCKLDPGHGETFDGSNPPHLCPTIDTSLSSTLPCTLIGQQTSVHTVFGSDNHY